MNYLMQFVKGLFLLGIFIIKKCVQFSLTFFVALECDCVKKFNWNV